LSDFVNQYDVVLSDIESSWMVPAFGGKIIASLHGVHWFNDHEDRKRGLKIFFDKNSTCTEKMEIIKKYNAKFVLIDNKRFGEIIQDCIFGEPIYENSKFILISVSTL
jgi:hypothetical protein